MDLYESFSASGARPVVTATFELPGLRKEDVHIDVLDNYMIIAGDRRHLHTLAEHTRDRDEEMKDVEAPTSIKDGDPDAERGALTTGAGTQEEALSHVRDGYTVREIKRGRFKRVLPLPAGTKVCGFGSVSLSISLTRCGNFGSLRM